MVRLAATVRWVGMVVAAVMAQPLSAQESGPIQEAIRGLRTTQGAPITGQRILGQPLEDSVGAFVPLRGGSSRPTIYGIVQNHLGELVPHAGTVLIRNIVDGQVVAEVKVDALAQFTVRGFEPGLYTAQLVDSSGHILASTGAFTAGVGEVIQLATVIPMAPLTGVASVLSNATQSVVSSATQAGVLALEAGPAISPQ